MVRRAPGEGGGEPAAGYIRKYIPTAAPHGPYYVPEKYRETVAARLEAALPKLPKLTPPQREQLTRYLGMIENLDDNIGRLEAFMSAENLRENTVLIFMADNGTTFGDMYFPCGMRGKKSRCGRVDIACRASSAGPAEDWARRTTCHSSRRCRMCWPK